LQKFSLGTLFYIFYNVVGERLQALAAEELYRREWLYESKSSLWYVLQSGEWKMFDLTRWEAVTCSPPMSPAYLSKEEVKASKTSAPA
jgi:CCR4-NOT transcription complex subunit 2